MRSGIALPLLLLATVTGGWIWMTRDIGPQIANFSSERLDVPNVTLIDQDARRLLFHGSLTEGQTLVINFSYTTCDSICPLGNTVLADLDAQLPPDANVRLMSITIDPGRDTPSRMRAAAERFGTSPRWSWLTGQPSEIGRLLQAFDADVANIELHDPVFLVGSLDSGRFYRSLSFPDATELAALVEQLDS